MGQIFLISVLRSLLCKFSRCSRYRPDEARFFWLHLFLRYFCVSHNLWFAYSRLIEVSKTKLDGRKLRLLRKALSVLMVFLLSVLRHSPRRITKLFRTSCLWTFINGTKKMGICRDNPSLDARSKDRQVKHRQVKNKIFSKEMKVYSKDTCFLNP